MVSKKVTVVNAQGMHMRPAGDLAKAVKAHPDCEVTLTANGKTVKAKAPMQIMSACIKCGNEMEPTSRQCLTRSRRCLKVDLENK